MRFHPGAEVLGATRVSTDVAWKRRRCREIARLCDVAQQTQPRRGSETSVTSTRTTTEGGADKRRGLGFLPGHIVQEFYWDDDVDEVVRHGIEDVTGEALVGGDETGAVDGVIIWWRADDADEDDLVDVLIDATANLDHGGVVWVLTPKQGRANHVSPLDIEDAAQTAGLHPTSATTVSSQWAGMRLTAGARQ